MKKKKSSAGILNKTFKYLFFFTLVFLALAFIASFFVLDTPKLLDQFLESYKITRSFLLFILSIPILQIGTLLFSFSILFSKMDGENALERELAMQLYLKKLIAILTVLLILNFLAFEFFRPFLKQKQNQYISQTDIYNSSIMEAKALKTANSLHKNKLAINFAKHALDVNPDSYEARSLLETLTLLQAQFLETSPPKEEIVVEVESLNAKALLDLANNSAENLDFFSAHYFACRAANLSANESEELELAKNMIQNSWLAIQNGSDSLANKNRKLYEKKLRAYSAFQRGDLLRAYDLFYALKQELKTKNLKDKQINYFLAETKEKLKSQVFHYEDLEKAPAFKTIKDFSFKIINGQHFLYEIKFDGFAYRLSKENSIEKRPSIFLRNLTLTKFNYVNKISWKIYAKYARLLPNPENKKEIRLQVSCVSSDRKAADCFPEIIIGEPSDSEMLFSNLPINTETFLIALENQNNLNDLDLIQLHKLSKNADKLGLDKKIFLNEMLFRLALPFLLFIISLALATIAWNFRFEYNQFKSAYFLFVPLIFLIAEIILEIADFFMSIILHFFLTKFYSFAFILALLSWLLFVIYYSWKFYKQAKN
ncbi:MAG: hypothetical protein P1P64_00695 [Treponemataceae bacterium]